MPPQARGGGTLWRDGKSGKMINAAALKTIRAFGM